MLTTFEELQVGQSFRFVGGVSLFVKTNEDWAIVQGNSSRGCSVPYYTKVMAQ